MSRKDITPLALNISQAARALNVSRPTFRNDIMPRMGVVRLQRRILVPVAAIEEFLRTNSVREEVSASPADE